MAKNPNNSHPKNPQKGNQQKSRQNQQKHTKQVTKNPPPQPQNHQPKRAKSQTKIDPKSPQPLSTQSPMIKTHSVIGAPPRKPSSIMIPKAKKIQKTVQALNELEELLNSYENFELHDNLSLKELIGHIMNYKLGEMKSLKKAPEAQEGSKQM